MRISNINIKNFKRFTDLFIHNIPETAKLVIVVGPNGCGKSSLFDALLYWYRTIVRHGGSNDPSYFQKDKNFDYDWNRNVEVSLHGDVVAKEGCLYVRTAYRNDPVFSISSLARLGAPFDEIKGRYTIHDDRTVSANYQRLVYDSLDALYHPENDGKEVSVLRNELIGQIRESMRNVFGDLVLRNLSDPLEEGTFFFEKGSVESYNYKNLSGGEKAAFDLLLDFHLKKKIFLDAIYCIDEIETHLHTQVQGALLREIVRIIPNNSQLWVTTHSLGVIREAQKIESSNANSVCIIDFDGIDPDIPGKLAPATIGRVSWDKMLSLAIGDLSSLIIPEIIVICEGSSTGNRRKDFDAEIYNRIFSTYASRVLFVSGGSSKEVEKTSGLMRKLLEQIAPQAKIVALVDRDDKSDDEVKDLESQDSIVLSERNLESFLFADDVIASLLTRENKQELLDKALEIKKEEIASSVNRGNPSDDIKSAAGTIYTELKKLLELKQAGGSTDAFMRDTLAPLIVPEMPTYQNLKSTIIDKLNKG